MGTRCLSYCPLLSAWHVEASQKIHIEGINKTRPWTIDSWFLDVRSQPLVNQNLFLNYILSIWLCLMTVVLIKYVLLSKITFLKLFPSYLIFKQQRISFYATLARFGWGNNLFFLSVSFMVLWTLITFLISNHISKLKNPSVLNLSYLFKCTPRILFSWSFYSGILF